MDFLLKAFAKELNEDRIRVSIHRKEDDLYVAIFYNMPHSVFESLKDILHTINEDRCMVKFTKENYAEYAMRIANEYRYFREKKRGVV